MSGANSAGEGARAIASDIDVLCIAGKLIKQGQEALRLGKLLIVVIRLNLQQGVIHAEAIVAHGPLEIGKIGFLAGKSLESREELHGRGIKRVVKSGFVIFRAFVVTKSLFAKVGQPLVNFEVDALKIVQFPGKIEYFLRERRIDFEWLRAGIVIELANVVNARAILLYLDFDWLIGLRGKLLSECTPATTVASAAGICGSVEFAQRSTPLDIT